MAGPQIVVEMDSDESKLWAGFQRIMRGEEGMEKGMGKVAGETRKAAAEQKALERAAKKVVDSVMTPQERYNQKIAELNLLYGKSKLTVDQFRAAVRQLDVAQQKTIEATIVKENTRRRGLEESQQAGTATFSGAAIQQIIQYAASVGSVSAALAKAVQMWRDLDQERQDAYERIKDSRAGMAELAGLAKSPEEAKELVDEAREAYTSGVGESEDEAAGLHYKLKSTGLYDQRKIFEDLSRSGVIRDVLPTVGATARIQAALGTTETGDATAVMSKLYQASDVTQYNVEQIAGAAAEPALFAGKLGMSDEELLAQLAAGMQTLDVEKAGTGARSFYQTLLEQGGFEGLSADEQMAKLKTTLTPMSAEEQKKFFGRVEGQTFYESLVTEQGQKTFREQMVALPEAERSQLAIQKTRLPEVDTGMRRTRMAEEAKRRRERQDMTEGETRALSETIIEERAARTKAEFGNTAAYVERKGLESARMIYGDEAVINESAYDKLLSGETQAEIGTPQGPRLRDEVATTAATGLGYAIAPQTTSLIMGIRDLFGLGEPTKPQSSSADPQMDEQTAVLKEISSKLDRSSPKPVPASSGAANRMNSE